MNKDILEKLLKSPSKSLLFTSKEKKDAWRIQVKRDADIAPFINEIKAEAKRLIIESGTELSYSLFRVFQENGNRLEYERVYFEKRRRLNTFAMMVLLEPEESVYRDELQNIIWSICDEYTWCLPAHIGDGPEMNVKHDYSLTESLNEERTIDLFAAETAFALAEVLELTGQYLDPLICKRIQKEIYSRIFWPFQTQNPFGWETATHNWSAVCAGSIGAAAIHLMKDSEELAIVLKRVLPAMDAYLSGFNDDGTCLEGYGYWQYGFGYYVYFADLLKKKTNNGLDLFQSEKVHQIALFQQRIFLNKNKLANFSDAVPTSNLFLGLSHYLSERYADFIVPEKSLRAKYTEDHCSRWAPAIRNLLWFNKDAEGRPWENTSYYFKESSWLISRHNKHAFAVKGGHNAEPHNHNDIGHFILLLDDELYLRDLGSGIYTKDYFGAKRYSFICTGSHGHSVPIIDGQYQQEGESYAATVKQVEVREEQDFFILEMAHVYNLPNLQSLTRTFTWVKTESPLLHVIDDYTFKEKPASIVERFITSVFKLTEDEAGIILHGKKKLRIHFDRKQLKFTSNKLDFVNHAGIKESLLSLDFTLIELRKSCEIQIAFQIE
ncbi:heparinase II/III family protein [Lederbergia lenta]|uniref:heparinase II/III family protein n=1 Tax=Lederbergia lenta TaxID=1467 RepID=UPI00203CA851|nr:heparinase II/III family protein [Lederbergia lenta]MCM3111832.1 heparinase II/III-family protein [Lederbergia lenta]